MGFGDFWCETTYEAEKNSKNYEILRIATYVRWTWRLSDLYATKRMLQNENFTRKFLDEGRETSSKDDEKIQRKWRAA